MINKFGAGSDPAPTKICLRLLLLGRLLAIFFYRFKNPKQKMGGFVFLWASKKKQASGQWPAGAGEPTRPAPLADRALKPLIAAW